MKRWEVTYYREPFLLYADTIEEVKQQWGSCMDEGSDIRPYTDTRYMKMVDEIKNGSEFIGEKLCPNQRDKREWYKCNCFCGEVFVRFSVDIADGIYYNYCQYQVWEHNRFITPITWTICDIEKFYNNIFAVDKMRYVEYSFRAHGQPKLSRPKELKGIKSIGSAEFIPKHCNTQTFIKDNDVWIKHTDYFSRLWRPPAGERVDMPQSYYLNKYFNISRTEKFVYADNWGGIVLRNEAWLKIENLIPMCKYKDISYLQIAREILQLQKRVITGMSIPVENEWERYWENVVKLVRNEIGITE